MRSGNGSSRGLLVICAAIVAGACAKGDAIATRSFDDPLPPLPSDESAAAAPSGAPVGAAGGAVSEWVLAFDDELDAPAFDDARWFVFDGDPHHRDTVSSASRSQATLHGGSAFISAVRTPENAAFPYAAGYVDTHGRFARTYGKIEFRARCKYAPGVWFALWGRAWADLVPEIDIEFLAEDITQVWLVNHWGVPPVPADERRGVTTVDGADITVFHTYTIVWKPNLVEWQIDGKAYRRVTDEHVPHDPMFWVMNAWVGGWGGTPGPATQFPASMEVDYLRIWRLGTSTVPSAVRISNARGSYAAGETIDVEVADFDAPAHVDVWDSGTRVATLDTPPFRFPARHLARTRHGLTFTASDGARTASTTLDVTIHD
jgi:beta-glucanase (GH16 family)